MIETLYIEEHLQQNARANAIRARFPTARAVICERFGEVFNPKAQHFRLQKQKPALILAEKYHNFVLTTPDGYGIGGDKNYYFSHMLNCLYDCRYCFLQGMYQSANYVLFVNYEDFQDNIKQLCKSQPDAKFHFFSGYDCDSLALEPVTGFAEAFLPFFENIPNAWLELRTKSTQIRSLVARKPLTRCVVAFSLSPDAIADKVEHKAPSLARRLAAITTLQHHGWQIGLRFDPIIYSSDYKQQYREFFNQVFGMINNSLLHSVSLGLFRLPEAYFKKIHKLYPDEKLFASPLQQQNGMVSYRQELEHDILEYCKQQILTYIPSNKFYPCTL